MKKLLLILAFAMPVFGFSQTVFSFVMEDSIYYGQADANNVHILEGKVKNLTADSLNFSWTLDSTDVASDWIVQICDKNVCYLPGTPGADFYLVGNEEGIMKPNIIAPTAYDGKIWLTVFNIEDTTQSRQYEIQINTLSASVDPLLEAGVSMSRNAPNPFTAETVIDLEMKGHNGELRITDMVGREVNNISLSVNQSQVRVQAGELSAGIYFYTLWMEGRPLISRKMQILPN